MQSGKILVVAGSVLLLVIFVAFFVFNTGAQLVPSPPPIPPETQLGIAEFRVGDDSFRVEIADSPPARTQGLSGRESLDVDAGMLFVFAEEQVQGFWMKGMNFPLDIIWIRGGTVVGIDANLPPNNNQDRPLYFSPEPVDQVLEVNAGEAARRGIQVGDEANMIARAHAN
jgi:uncharacterized protein